MRVLWLDPFHGGSHAAVAAGYAARAAHSVQLLTLPISGGWRWRMRGGAITLARLARTLDARPDLIVASDMLDLATFRALTADRLGGVPAAIYFHENQLTYPLPPGRQRDLSFAWVNYTAALTANAVIFNSDFHRRSFLAALPGLLGRYHDYQELDTVAQIAAKSHVLPPGIDLASLDDQATSPAARLSAIGYRLSPRAPSFGTAVGSTTSSLRLFSRRWRGWRRGACRSGCWWRASISTRRRQSLWGRARVGRGRSTTGATRPRGPPMPRCCAARMWL
jgi:hypothetical protein